MSDWIGEHANDENVNGFHFCSGSKPDTKGIWMWSEIFTYDRDDGEKIAIILLDTQGIFDNESSMKECTAIFAISMMLSTMNSSPDEKPFQKFVFVVRDWPYSYENGYGYSQAVTDYELAETKSQSDDMRHLRTRIRSTIDVIQTFLMPFPGPVVLEENFCGNL